jgi:hypothetical protein
MSYLLLDNLFVSAEEQGALHQQCVRTGMLISGLIRSIEHRQS